MPIVVDGLKVDLCDKRATQNDKEGLYMQYCVIGLLLWINKDTFIAKYNLISLIFFRQSN